MATTDLRLMGAMGTTGLPEYGGYVFDEWLTELQGPRGRRVIREMLDNSAVVGACMLAIEMLIRRTVWTVVPGAQSPTGGTDPTAELVQQCLDDMEITWPDTLSEILQFLPFGWSLHELCYKRRDGVQSKYSDGRIGWSGWQIRGQETLLRWDFGDAGEILGMIQLGPPDWREHYIPMEKALLFRTTVRRNNPEGRSILRNAYISYYHHKHIMAIEGIGIERDLAGLPVAWVPPDIMAGTATAEEQATYAAFKDLVTNIKRDEMEGVVMPLEYDQQGNKRFDLTLLSTGGQRQFDTNQIIERYKTEIAQSLLADFIMLGHTDVGTQALGQTKSDLFQSAMGAWLDTICAQVNDVAIPKLLALNGIVTDTPPRLEHGDIKQADLISLGTFIQALATAGFELDRSATGELLKHMLDEARLPQPPEDGSDVQPGNGTEDDDEDVSGATSATQPAPESPDTQQGQSQ